MTGMAGDDVMNSPVTQAQFEAFLAEFRQLRENSVTKHDVFQVVLLVQTAYFAVVVGTIVVLNVVDLL